MICMDEEATLFERNTGTTVSNTTVGGVHGNNQDSANWVTCWLVPETQLQVIPVQFDSVEHLRMRANIQQ